MNVQYHQIFQLNQSKMTIKSKPNNNFTNINLNLQIYLIQFLLQTPNNQGLISNLLMIHYPIKINNFLLHLLLILWTTANQWCYRRRCLRFIISSIILINNKIPRCLWIWDAIHLEFLDIHPFYQLKMQIGQILRIVRAILLLIRSKRNRKRIKSIRIRIENERKKKGENINQSIGTKGVLCKRK